jgi:Copper type II ascorbate-dependent monooxygenase, C-terminal domain
MRLRFWRILGALAVVVTSLVALSAAPGGALGPRVHTITMQASKSYTPDAPAGATDDYHCTLVNPHVTKNSFIVSSHFFPGSLEVHHAIIFLVPPNLAAAAESANKGGNGWTCFGESALPGTVPLNQISNTPWLSAWAPGHGEDVLPAGTGVPLPAGSLVVMQVHYNLLVGDHPVRVKMQLNTVPSSTPLRPLSLDLMPAPPDIPCPTGVTGPLCSRSASLANLGQRFGQSQVSFVNIIEQVCGRNPSDPPAGDTTSCTWPIGRAGNIVRLGVHMHLLGRSMKIVLNPGTAGAKTLLDVSDYNFHYQRSYNLKTPVKVVPSDTIGVTCSYDPTLAQQLPALRKVPPHFVTWGDGSSDEMCLALVETTPPNSEPEKVALADAFATPGQTPDTTGRTVAQHRAVGPVKAALGGQ